MSPTLVLCVCLVSSQQTFVGDSRHHRGSFFKALSIFKTDSRGFFSLVVGLCLCLSVRPKMQLRPLQKRWSGRLQLLLILLILVKIHPCPTMDDSYIPGLVCCGCVYSGFIFHVVPSPQMSMCPDCHAIETGSLALLSECKFGTLVDPGSSPGGVTALSLLDTLE